MRLQNWQAGLLCLALGLLSFTFMGSIFRNFFTYWFFSGTSQGKTITFFFFIGLLFLLLPLTKKIKVPEKMPAIIFAISISLLFLLGFLGTMAVFDEQLAGLDKPYPYNGRIFFFNSDAAVNINWLAFTHNHYFKPVITPALYFLRSMNFDIALPLYAAIPPPMLWLGGLLFLVALFSFLFFAREKEDSPFFLLYAIAGFGLVFGTLDGGFLSAIVQINLTIMALLLIREKIKQFEPVIQAVIFIALVLLLQLLWQGLCIYLFDALVGTGPLIMIPKLGVALLLPLAGRTKFPASKPLLAALFLIFVIGSLVNFYPFVAANTKDVFGVQPQNEFYLSVITGPDNTREELASLGELTAFEGKTFRLETFEAYTFEQLFLKLESRGIKAAILENDFWG